MEIAVIDTQGWFWHGAKMAAAWWACYGNYLFLKQLSLDLYQKTLTRNDPF